MLKADDLSFHLKKQEKEQMLRRKEITKKRQEIQKTKASSFQKTFFLIEKHQARFIKEENIKDINYQY